MAKYHINDQGKIVECKASKRGCPKQNFGSIEEAEKFIQQESGINLPTISHKSKNVKEAEKFYGGKFITPYTITLDKNIEKVLDDLYNIGNPLIVGGAVRDSFEHYKNKDIDIEVHQTDMDKLVKHLKNNGYTVDEVGKQFGVLKVSKKGTVSDLDISVPRKENRTGAGHRSFSVDMDASMTVEEAAERRDFTFNAVMYDHKRKVLVDPAHGQKDYKDKIMRHVSEKFAEDPLRVLRGFQFAGRFNMAFADETAEMCKNLRQEYSHLSTERVQEEWGKFFTKSHKPSMGIKALQDSGWDNTINGLQESLHNKKVHEALDKLSQKDLSHDKKVIYGASIIAQEMQPDKRNNFFNSVIIGKDQQKLANTLVNVVPENLQTEYDRKRFAFDVQRSGFTFKQYLELSRLQNNKNGIKVAQEALKEGLSNGPEKDFIQGKDILEKTDKKPGPWMGELLNNIRDEQFKGSFKNKEEALQEALHRIKIM